MSCTVYHCESRFSWCAEVLRRNTACCWSFFTQFTKLFRTEAAVVVKPIGDGEGEGGLISETIMPWESYNFSLTHEYSTFGDYNIFFEVDPENLIFEFDESNNFFETTITLDEEICVKGDVNLDGEIDVLDIVFLVSIILDEVEPNGLQFCAGDYNSDGVINVSDIVVIVNEILNP